MFKDSIRSKILGGNLQDAKNYIYGCYKGFYLTIEMASGQYIVTIMANASFDENNVQLSTFLQQQKNLSNKIISAQAYKNSLNMIIKAPALAKNVADTINTLVSPIIDYLYNNQYNSGCEHCGNTEDLNCYEVNGRPAYLCENCKNDVHSSLQENQEAVLSQKSNLLSGLIGAFLGSLIGAVLWIAIYRFGYIAGIAGVVTGICAMKGYGLLGGSLDKKGVIGSVVIMIITIYFANKIAWSWEAYDVLKEYDYTFSDTFVNLYEILTDSDLVFSYFKDLLIGYLLTAVASYRDIINAFRATTGNYTIQKKN